ncbi:MAG TPA: DUF1343 domain-containing protein [Gemmatimonadaceae bacterium]|nr:DUF1343 domain-containing protein [Gemmatimonadaceae bacterium]
MTTIRVRRAVAIGAAFTTLIASGALSAQASPRVTLGISILLEDSVHLVRGKRVGLITNHTGRDEQGRSTIDLLHSAAGVRLTALFGPEHGIRGEAGGGERIASTVDRATGVPIFSLYGETLAPTAQMLETVDVLIYDIQDVGARMYTYVWTMTLAAEAARKAGRRFIVLDRPNPIRADVIEGGFIEPRYRSFTGLHNVPMRYGLTPGEVAVYLAGTKQISADVTVVPMKGYRRSMWWDDTGLPWVNPSPNIRSADAALLYPGISFFEATNVSEGRGTVSPFHFVGASWLTDAPAVAQAMNLKKLPGVRFESTRQQIARGQKYGGRSIPMVRIIITRRDDLRSAEIGAHLLREIYIRHPKEFRWRANGIEELSGSRSLRHSVERGGITALLAQWRRESARFKALTAQYLLYSP